jgi:dTDP-4-amino-4,6-dideoxygalactose transaminase
MVINMNIPVIIPYTDHRETEEMAKVVSSGWVAQGPKVAEFEKAVAAHEGIGYGIATTSCTTALHLVLHVMGIGAGHDVLVPSFTFVASANSIIHAGAKPIFVDVLKETYCIEYLSVRKCIEDNYSKKDGKLYSNHDGNILTAIMCVHQFGLCADMSSLSKLAGEYGLKIIEDSACALGARIGDKHQGSFGNPACLSFHPRKSITTGEGGMILTDDNEFAERLRGLRSHGATASEIVRHNNNSFLLPPFDSIGYNYRMTDIQAAMGLAQMEKLDYIIKIRRQKAARYNELLSNIDWLVTPIEPEGFFHTYQSYVCMLSFDGLSSSQGGEKRDKLLTLLAEKGVATRQGTHASHTLECYRKLYGIDPECIPNAYACDRLSLTLPLYVQMSDTEQDYVVEMLVRGYKEL